MPVLLQVEVEPSLIVRAVVKLGCCRLNCLLKTASLLKWKVCLPDDVLQALAERLQGDLLRVRPAVGRRRCCRCHFGRYRCRGQACSSRLSNVAKLLEGELGFLSGIRRCPQV